MNKKTDSARKLIEALEMSLSGQDVVEDGFHPIDYWMKKWNYGEYNARNIIREHVKYGRMALKKFRVKTEKQASRLVTHWKAVK
jgi:hypothetical protein